MINFSEYLNRRDRDIIKQLKILEKVFEMGGLKVEDYTNKKNDMHLFVYDPAEASSFEGIRVYKIGETIAYRVQKLNNTHPYGKAYTLDVDGIYEDFIEDVDKDEHRVAKKVAKTIVDELKSFFKESAKAEKEEDFIADDPFDRILVKSAGGTDYSNQILNGSRNGTGY